MSQDTGDYAASISKIESFRGRIQALHKEIRAVQEAIEPQPVADYVFTGAAGPVRLSQLFGGKADLFVIHNMGTGCIYCTMWADGFNGVYEHLADRAAFVVSSPDTPEVQRDFAAGRGWRFPMVSHQSSSFAEDMGYRRDGRWHPGVSAFKQINGGVARVSDTALGPNDDFCSVWHFLGLLPEGANGWQPKYRYG